MKRLQQLARELGVTVAYLAGDTEAAQDQHELELLKAYRIADARDRLIVDTTLLKQLPPPAPRALPPPANPE